MSDDSGKDMTEDAKQAGEPAGELRANLIDDPFGFKRRAEDIAKAAWHAGQVPAERNRP